jgi:hypothetical protein
MSRIVSSDHAHRESAPLRPKTRRWPALALLLSTALLAVGCGESWLEVFPVSGSIKFNGQTPAGAQLVFHAVNPADPAAPAPKASVKPDGSFVVTSYQSGDGAPPGDYVVTVEWYQVDKDGNVGPNVVPKEYSDPKASPIKVTVAAGAPTTLEPIAITAKTARAASAPLFR